MQMRTDGWVDGLMGRWVDGLMGRWVYKTKRNSDGSIDKYKARWVIKRYKQRSELDYNETTRRSSNRLLTKSFSPSRPITSSKYNKWTKIRHSYTTNRTTRLSTWIIYTQDPSTEDSKDITKWEEAADYLTPTISSAIKKKLSEEESNNGYKMLQKLAELLQPGGATQFMRLTREYYSLRYDESESISAFLTKVKILEERIDATNITMDHDKRALLCLTMSLPTKYRSLTQIWMAMEDMIASKAKEMFLEEEQNRKGLPPDKSALWA
ncbi:MAG: hypothetical protein M1812_002085 [Candelaria pacifica]|nr:MAG: hypothetical protein M1812_002085 [Candelaria pacifica]